MKSKNLTLMMIAIGCGLVAAVLTAKLSGGNAPDMVDVIVAKKELPVGTLLEEKELENMVGLAKFPRASLPPDTVVNVDDLKGKKLGRTLKIGNFFAQGDVAMDNGIRLPEGMYKYTVKTDVVKTAGGFAQPGDHVDVQLTETQPNGKVKSGFVLRDVLVLAIDSRVTRNERGEAVAQVNGVSLAVTPQQSLYLSAAERRGDVKLVLRDSKDTDKTPVDPIDTIKGYDKKTEATETVGAVKMATVVFAKNMVPVNTFINNDNFANYFISKEVPEEGVSAKAVHDPSTLRDKFVTRAIEPDEMVFSNWLSAEKLDNLEPKKPMIVMAEPEALETLPAPREKEKPLYPRKFEQIINNQHFWFIETAPGDFRRADAPTAPAEVKDLPDSNGMKPEKLEEKKPDEARGDRPV